MSVLKASRTRTCILLLVANCCCLLFARTSSQGSPRVNQDSLIIRDFENRVADYVKLHKKVQAEAPAPKRTDSAAKIKEAQVTAAPKIRTARPEAKQGDIFTPEISELFRRLIATPLKGPDGPQIRASLRHAEPVDGIHLRVNAPYPEGVPLQSTPPSLLLNLPQLPPELEYRIVGRALVLRDVGANVIVDFIPGAIPSA